MEKLICLKLVNIRSKMKIFLIVKTLLWDHPFNSYVKFSEKLLFSTPWYANAVFRKILCTYQMNDSHLSLITGKHFAVEINQTVNIVLETEMNQLWIRLTFIACVSFSSSCIRDTREDGMFYLFFKNIKNIYCIAIWSIRIFE